MEISDILILETWAYQDFRGYFMEMWHADRYAAAGLPHRFVQDNVSVSVRGVLRGLHYQHPSGQDKLISVLQGSILDVAVDVRLGSPTFARWVVALLSAESPRQLFVPKGFAHGFLVLSDTAVVAYKCTEFYRPECESSVRWDDPDLGIHWPIRNPLLSEKDRDAPRLRDVPQDRLPPYHDDHAQPAGMAGTGAGVLVPAALGVDSAFQEGADCRGGSKSARSPTDLSL
jgi:dTDP-4-dehydrorhamnose 3,5-epimerase